MAPKIRSKSSLDADAVARMMREQDESAETPPPVELEAAPPVLQAEPEAASTQPPAPEPSPEPVQVEPPAPPPAPRAPEGAPSMLGPREAPTFDPGQVDGRSLRRTGREPFATRIKPEVHAALKRIAYTRGITIAEALETAVAEYERR